MPTALTQENLILNYQNVDYFGAINNYLQWQYHLNLCYALNEFNAVKGTLSVHYWLIITVKAVCQLSVTLLLKRTD